MKKQGAAFLFALLCLFTGSVFGQTSNDTLIDYGNPARYTLGGIRVVADGPVDANVIISISGLKIGEIITIPGDEITKAIQNLWAQKLFSDVKVKLDSFNKSEAKIWLSIYLKTRPRLARYTFTGIPKSQAKKLKEEIRIQNNDIVTDAMLSRVVRDIKAFYVAKGYPSAKVNISAEQNDARGNNMIDLKIAIDRGSRTKIEEIDFEGNQQFTDKKLRKQMKKTKEYAWWNIFRTSKFKTEEYETDKEAVIAYYRRNGFKDVQITSDSTWMAQDNRMNIRINLSEGHKYYFRNINWAGNTKYTSTFLNKILNINKGAVYNQDLLERNLYISESGVDVTSLYMDDGYLFFSVTPVEVLVENDSVDIEIRIYEGPQATINKVTVTGNTKTHDRVILRTIRTKPGMKFSRSDIIRSQRELAMLGPLDPEKMNVIPKPNPKDGTVDLEYQVTEKPSDQIELSGGWGAGRIVGVLGLSLNNFSMRNVTHPNRWQGYPSGDGQSLSIRAQSNGPEFQSYNASFTEPWLGGKRPTSLSVSGFYSVQRYGSSASESRQELTTPGVTVGLGKTLRWPDDYFTFYTSATYQYYTVHNYPLIENFQSGYANNIYFRFALSRSSIDDQIYPTHGSIFNASLQLTPPISLFSGIDYAHATQQQKYKYIEYHKWKFEYSNFHNIKFSQNQKGNGKLVIYTSAKFGLIGLYNHDLGYTPFERFLVGGDGLAGYNLNGAEMVRLRGYETYDDVTPKIYNLSKTAILESGATIYNKYTFEVRYPVVETPAAKIFGLAFLEGGNAWQRYKNFDPFSVKRSAGVGVRAFLPMFGMLGFDWGYGFDPSVQDPGGPPSKGHFHFYIGQPLGD